MHIISKITAAVVLAGGLSIAAQAQANSTQICNVLASVAASADAMRQSGMSQRQAAAVIGNTIGGALSNERALPIHERQRLANAVGRWGTVILRVVYSHPIEQTAFMRDASPEITGNVVWDMCMRGEL